MHGNHPLISIRKVIVTLFRMEERPTGGPSVMRPMITTRYPSANFLESNAPVYVRTEI